MSAADADRTLRRFELDAVGACLVTAVAAVVLSRGRLDAGLGVLGGGALMGISYWGIKGGVEAVVSAAAGRQRPPGEPGPAALSAGRRIWLAVKFFTRYALLAVAAYVMLTCFRLHPVGVLAGAASPFLAALVLLGRLGRARARRRLP